MTQHEEETAYISKLPAIHHADDHHSGDVHINSMGTTG